jgi:bisphosphoglycerate-independent phosphoglycerate mutase (AlkP superfamily)
VRVNLPNGDMVGHTGDIEATVVACKVADEAVKVKNYRLPPCMSVISIVAANALCLIFIDNPGCNRTSGRHICGDS